jgi:hypothetical protein
MRITLIVIIVLFWTTLFAAHARIRVGPGVGHVFVDPEDPDRVLLQLIEVDPTHALSTNGGASFEFSSATSNSGQWTTNLSFESRDYMVLDGWRLFRSDDAGNSWEETGVRDFLRQLTDDQISDERSWVESEYSARVPERSVHWNRIFAGFAVFFLLSQCFMMSRRGVLAAVISLLQGALILLITWSLLTAFHFYVSVTFHGQYPGAYWNTSQRIFPTLKTGVAMAIAAQPLPLLAYLLAFWFVLPGSLEMALGRSPSNTRRRWTFVVLASWAALFVAFNALLVFWGYFWE